MLLYIKYKNAETDTNSIVIDTPHVAIYDHSLAAITGFPIRGERAKDTLSVEFSETEEIRINDQIIYPNCVSEGEPEVQA